MSDSIGSESHTPPLNLENFKMPTLEEIFDNINAMQLSEEEKEKMKENIVSRYEAYMKGVNGQGHAGDAPAAAAAAAAKKFVPFAMDYVLILLWIVLLLVIGNYSIHICNVILKFYILYASAKFK